MTGARKTLPFAVLTLFTASATFSSAAFAADPVTLRFAAIAPDGTAWARELKAFARDVENTTNGELKIKWYLSGIAGDELTALERVKHGQLDGEAGAIFCQRLAPSLRVMRLVGQFQSRDEAIYVMGRMKPQLDEEFRKSGFANLGEGIFGIDVLFSRQPVRSMDDLKRGRYWAWNLDPIVQATLPEMGLKTSSTSLDELAAAYHDKQVDAFFAVPSAALAYQWSTQVGFVAPFDVSVLPACITVANSAMDPLPIDHQNALRTSAAKFMARFNQVSHDLETGLMNGLFEKQGLVKVQVPPTLRSDFYAAAHAARQKLGDKLVPAALMSSVEKMVAEYREQQRKEARRP
jgi:TRAP-type transport system periplasmic protein